MGGVERALSRRRAAILARRHGHGRADGDAAVSGSSDLYQPSGRRPFHSINFITSHDGYTLDDLVSYERKHNQANGEGNRDGDNNNYSANYGVEGPTRRKHIDGAAAAADEEHDGVAAA